MSNRAPLKNLSAPPETVPVPDVDVRRGNQFPEPSGTVGTTRTGPIAFEPVGAFMERAAQLPDPTWLVEGLIPDSGRIFVVAAPNAGKTFLALVTARAAGDQGRTVRLVLEEGGPKATANRLRDLGFTPDLPVEIALNAGFQLKDSASRQQLVGFLRSHTAPVVILDPFSSIFDGNENETRDVNVARTHLDELARANPRALIILLHHMSKAGERDGAGIYAARGSGILSAWTDVQLNLTHEETPKGSGKVAFTAKVTKFRDGERDGRFRVQIDLHARTTEIRAISTKAQPQKEKLIAALEASSEPISGTQLAGRAKIRKVAALALLREMEGSGEVRELDGGGWVLTGDVKSLQPEMDTQI
jgi:Fe2+ transport system protein FeoA